MPAKNLISFRKGTSNQWISASTPLASGEPGYDITNNILKIGNGTDLWSSLKSVVDIQKDVSISGIINAKSIILGNKPTPNWNSYSTYNKFDIVKYQNDLYVALINFTTECPGGVGPEGWQCCQDNIYTAPTAADCPGFGQLPQFTSFSPTGYPNGWSLMGSGDLQSSNICTKDLFVEKLKVGNNSIIETNVYSSSASINHTSIGLLSPSQGKFTNLFTNGSINVSNGTINVNELNSQYSAVVSSYGLKLFDNTIDAEVTQVDTNLGGYDFTPSGFLTANGFTVLGGSGPIIFNNLPEDNDIVLFSNFENPVNNGIYRLEQIPDSDPEYPQYKFKAIRATSYTNGSSIPNRYGVRVNDNNSRKFILNRYSNGNSIIGTDPLVFEYDSGDEVMTIQDSLDVDFVGAIAAKAKYFRIKHPDPNSPYSVLQYGSLESPYNGIRLTGKDKLNKGICEVRLPNYLKHLIHEEDISIQLTNKGHHKILYVDKIDLNNSSFTVKGYRSKTGGPFEFFWTFSGVRKDIDPLIVEH